MYHHPFSHHLLVCGVNQSRLRPPRPPPQLTPTPTPPPPLVPTDKKFVKDFLIDDLRWQLDVIEAFTYLSPTLQRDPEVILAAMAKDLNVMRRCPETALSVTLKFLSREFPKGSEDKERKQTCKCFLTRGKPVSVSSHAAQPTRIYKEANL